ncbi:putative RNA polymerase beta prime subunit [Ralstonia phage RP31]|uniref:Putative RNA polymerase beta prime subunit n=1 Tax=Ralstonia phage RP31 TaxID=1923890 RepID=A0A1L7N279_9CAUD|nr:putative RNA polymerase beta prime subunit [Ralstonia phage RP31]
MSLKRIAARTILGLSIEQTWETLMGPFILVFDDGEELETNHKEVIYSRYFWEFHANYPGLPILKKHHIQSVLKGNRVGMETHIKLIQNVLWDCADFLAASHNIEQMVDIRFELAELAYNLSNQHYNDMVTRLEEYVTSLNLFDFHRVFKDQDVVDAYERAKPDEESIADIYYTIDSVLKHKPELRNNALSKLYRSGLVSSKQVHQCLGPRGFLTDINNERFGIPIMRGYYQGIRSQRDIQIESRSAAKALNASKGDLQDTEYFSRKLRTMDMGVERLHHMDCGTTRYLNWRVQGKREDRPSDLEILEGKHFVDDDGILKTVHKDDKHLIGRTLKLRSAMYCGHPTDPNGICSVCYGMMSELIPANSNIGHANCTHVTEKNAQGVLSTKHLDSSKSIAGATIDARTQQFVKLSTDGNRYLFADTLKANSKNGDLFLMFDCEAAPNLSDIFIVDNLQVLPESRMSELSEVIIRNGKGEGEEISLQDGKRLPFLTYEFLEHVKTHSYTVDEETGCYMIPLKGWKWSVPFASLPMRDFSMSDHSRDIAKVLESTVKEVVERDRLIDPASTLVELTELMNRKARVNLAVVEVTLRGALIRSAERYDYSMPKPWTESGLGVLRNIILYRSLAPFMAYEHHAEGIYAPESFSLKNRPDHPFDGIVMPREVFDHQQRVRNLQNGPGNY